jgi:alkanesulfonate monooxygenase SsuD/methylene tetrahydromethanopterin reductase-like flavin-dependent oxidoreductase (luciferase family)
VLNDRLDLGLMFSFRNPAAWRRPFPDVYRSELDLVEQAERLGFDTIWLTEHHFADDGYSPSIIPLAAAIAARTERVRIGFNLLLLPLHNAVRVAEDIATLDVLSGGRIDVGVGQGYARHEFAGYGIDRRARLGLFREGLDVLRGLWTNDTFSYRGTHYTIDEARLMPKPVQQPMPPLWIGATSTPGVRRAGLRGANLLGLTNPRLQQVYENARTEAGYDLDDAKALQLHWTHVGATDDDAWAEAAAHFHHLLAVYAQWLVEAEDPGNTVRNVDVPPAEALRTSKPVLFQPVFGSPDTVVTALNRSIARVRTTHLALGVLPGIDPRVTGASMERFAAEVAPRLT